MRQFIILATDYILFMKANELKAITDHFTINRADGGFVISSIGNGHINDTYLVDAGAGRYVLQRINDNVFRQPSLLMENIVAVTEYLDGPLRIIPASDGRHFYHDESGYWRMMTFIDNAYSLESEASEEEFCEIGRAYGEFIEKLSGLQAEKLHYTIEGFHDTRKRFKQFTAACHEDRACRCRNAREEIRFANENEKYADILNDFVANGEIPLRVVHNDTKINNILLDVRTGKAACVVDLDTVMPGLAVTDFGDAIRSGASTGREDEESADGIRLDMCLYRAFEKGFLAGCPGLTQREKELLPVGALVMTYECGLRFLTDYLEGDPYFKTDYPEHNLVRCRNQFSLLRDMQAKLQVINM